MQIDLITDICTTKFFLQLYLLINKIFSIIFFVVIVISTSIIHSYSQSQRPVSKYPKSGIFKPVLGFSSTRFRVTGLNVKIKYCSGVFRWTWQQCALSKLRTVNNDIRITGLAQLSGDCQFVCQSFRYCNLN